MALTDSDRARPLSLLGAYALIVLGVVAAYYPSFDGLFLLDDQPAILYNRHLHELPALAHALVPPAEPLDGDRWRGPIVTLTLALNYRCGGLDPRGYHAVNLALHVLATVTLFATLRRIFTLDRLGERYGATALPAALVCTLLWAVHPLNIDSVTYVIQRSGLLAGLFYVLVFYCVVRGATGGASRRWDLAAIVACAFGMLSKETMITAPIMVLLFDRVFLSGSFRDALRRPTGLYIGLAITYLPLVWLMAVSPHHTSIGFHLDVAPWGYLEAQCPVLLHYLSLVFWPHKLIFDYGRTLPVSPAEYFLPGLLILALLLATGILLWRRPKMGFLGAWFFVILAPTSSVIPLVLEVGAERRMYLPLIAVIVGVVLAVLEALRTAAGSSISSRRLRAAGVVAMLAVVALGWRTAERNRLYSDPEALYRTVVDRRPQNWRGHLTLGRILFNRNSLQEAETQFLLALEDKPNSPFVHNHLGRSLAARGDFVGAIRNYRRAIEVKPDYVKAYYNLGIAQKSQGHMTEAISAYRSALEIDPEFAPALGNLGNTLLRQGRTTEAIAHYRRAIAADPSYVEAHSNLGIVLQHLGETEAAIAEFQKALALQPELPQAHHELGKTLTARGDWDAGLQHHLLACRSVPDWPSPHIAAAWLLATHPQADRRDPAQSIRLAQRAVELTRGRDARALDVLAAGLAASGRFDDAVLTLSRAIEVLPQASGGLRVQIEARREMYQTHQPFVLPAVTP